ncbi:MAG: hypothetical protein M3Z75_22795 [Actinomycetota bacterium]|nr:hypothetical protein [Actinomycetota bacterium]
MHVRFPRRPDHQRGYALVERDDGVRYRLYGGTAGPRLPRDIRHLIVERELGLDDGIWAGIAAGVVFPGMQYVSGRRPPHAAQRSTELIWNLAGPGLRAELLANLVEVVTALDNPAADQIDGLARSQLAALPGPEVDPAAIAAAATALQVEASRWARLRVGEELSYAWPGEPRGSRERREPGEPQELRELGELRKLGELRGARSAGAQVPWIVRPHQGGNRRRARG